MLSSQFRSLALLAAAAAAAWGAYENRATPLTSALLALACAGLVGFVWIRGSRGKQDMLHDPAVSTLVFPPESKFEQSVLPKR